MEPTSPERHLSKRGVSPCGCPYWRDVAIDSLLELAATRERFSQVDEDEVELIAAERFRFYRLVGGTTLTEGAFRAKTRRWMETGEW